MDVSPEIYTEDIEVNAAEKAAFCLAFGWREASNAARSIVQLIERTGFESGPVPFTERQGNYVYECIWGPGQLDMLGVAPQHVIAAAKFLRPVAVKLREVFPVDYGADALSQDTLPPLDERF